MNRNRSLTRKEQTTNTAAERRKKGSKGHRQRQKNHGLSGDAGCTKTNRLESKSKVREGSRSISRTLFGLIRPEKVEERGSGTMQSRKGTLGKTTGNGQQKYWKQAQRPVPPLTGGTEEMGGGKRSGHYLCQTGGVVVDEGKIIYDCGKTKKWPTSFPFQTRGGSSGD